MNLNKKTFVAACFVFCGFTGLFAEDRQFSSVNFNGIKNISKYEIVKAAGIRVTSEEIFVNTDKLRKALAENTLIESFSIDAGSSRLSITVVEKNVSACIAVKVKDTVIPVLVGDDFAVIAVAKAADVPGPLFVVNNSEIIGNSMSVKYQDMYKLMKQLSFKYPTLYKEIEEVALLSDGSIEIGLKVRPVRCRMQGNFQNLRRLNYILGYMDAAGVYPDFLEINGDSVVIR